MVEERLIDLLERVLGKSKKTTGDNYAFYSPFTEHYKPKLEINIKTTSWPHKTNHVATCLH